MYYNLLLPIPTELIIFGVEKKLKTMNTVQKGNTFENRVFSVLKELVESEQLAIDKKNGSRLVK